MLGSKLVSHADSSQKSIKKVKPALSGLSVDVAGEMIAALADCSADFLIMCMSAHAKDSPTILSMKYSPRTLLVKDNAGSGKHFSEHTIHLRSFADELLLTNSSLALFEDEEKARRFAIRLTYR